MEFVYKPNKWVRRQQRNHELPRSAMRGDAERGEWWVVSMCPGGVVGTLHVVYARCRGDNWVKISLRDVWKGVNGTVRPPSGV